MKYFNQVKYYNLHKISMMVYCQWMTTSYSLLRPKKSLIKPLVDDNIEEPCLLFDRANSQVKPLQKIYQRRDQKTCLHLKHSLPEDLEKVHHQVYHQITALPVTKPVLSPKGIRNIHPRVQQRTTSEYPYQPQGLESTTHSRVQQMTTSVYPSLPQGLESTTHRRGKQMTTLMYMRAKDLELL